MNPEAGRIPDWAQRERWLDLDWIGENFYLFWPVATNAFQEVGRGAVAVDTTTLIADTGHPITYFTQDEVRLYEDANFDRLVAQYVPERELVIILIKAEGRTSAYRLGIPPATE